MTNEKTDLIRLQKKAMEEGSLDNRAYDKEVLKKIKDKILVLRFGPDNEGTRIVSRYRGLIVFADWNGQFTPEDGDVWACAVKEDKGNAIIVDLLIKITPVLLLKLGDPVKAEIENTLWEMNRKAYEKKFEEMYKDELFGQIKAAFEEEYSSQIAEKDNIIASLNAELDVQKALIKQYELDQKLGKVPVSNEITYTEKEPPAIETPVIPVLPSANQSMAPGLPDLNINEVDFRMPPDCRFRVECHEGTIRSESFPDGHYFVHLTPSREFIVVRPHSSGGALCINHAINVKALRSIFLKYEDRELVCEYNPRYQGLIVYLNRAVPLREAEQTGGMKA